MTAYYNDIDKSVCAWLRELIKHGLIADGVVDERSVTDVSASDLKDFTQIHLFAGIGGFSKALRMAGWSDDRPVFSASHLFRLTALGLTLM
jgi:DNA (cytosine-5)-methyltransferase 1